MVFSGWGLPPEGTGGCLEGVLVAILEDVGYKMLFFLLSWEMLWHLGAKMAHKSAKTRQDSRLGGGAPEFLFFVYLESV